jgi:hypothetical protein
MVEFIQLKRLLSIVTAFFVVGNPNGGILPIPITGVTVGRMFMPVMRLVL